MRRSTSTVRRACAVGTTVALIGLTTGLGVMTATAATAAESNPAVSAPATAAADGTTPSDTATDGTGTPATGSEADGSTPPAGDTTGDDAPAGDDSGVTGPDTEPTDAGTPGTGSTAPAGTPAAPAATTPTEPTATATTPAAAAAVEQSVTITGDLYVGSDLVARQSGFTKGSKISYVWTSPTGAVLSESATYTITTADAGQEITVTLEGSVAGETATATTETAVAPVFVDEDGQPLSDEEGDTSIEATAGEAFSQTFRALSTPAPELSASSFDDDGNEQSTLPKGISFDAKTGVLSGTLTDADQYYQVMITATSTSPSGPVSNQQFVDIDVQAGAPVGIEVVTLNQNALEDGSDTTAWIIHPNGDVYTGDLLSDSEPVKGGKVTVKQGGTLLVSGAQVDRFGNQIMPDFDEETGEPEFFTPTVTSDVATDVIAADSDLGGVGLVSVTFPHASTHTLTVSGAAVPSTVFAVDVQPTIAPAAVIKPIVPAAVATHHTGSGRLAYTGTDATGALPWALGLLVAGAGLIGARTLRRRRAQR
ncbi:putative Ig domain-containing protein [Curtobacterium flaccumfaciens]|uniref:putative Ig domain-containing protein n=1 Tax=Curtobacterium flaccumfaciens TaxID=2035 RepID=UPI003EB8454D